MNYNEYSGTYIVRRKIYADPLNSIVDKVREFHEKHTGIRLQIIDDGARGSPFDGKSIVQMLFSGLGAEKGKEVKVAVSGNFSQELLKQCADEIGGIFEFDDGSTKGNPYGMGYYVPP